MGMLAFSLAGAQDTSNDQADVWAVVESQWNADEQGDKDWFDELLTEEFAGWEESAPAPRNRASTKLWDRVMDGVGTMTAHELYPLSIVVRGDVAVAHYLYTTASKDPDGKMTLENGRFTDVLVRTDGGWKFLAWHGGNTD
jgi:ketosteroid isomerase-like protein